MAERLGKERIEAKKTGTAGGAPKGQEKVKTSDGKGLTMRQRSGSMSEELKGVQVDSEGYALVPVLHLRRIARLIDADIEFDDIHRAIETDLELRKTVQRLLDVSTSIDQLLEGVPDGKKAEIVDFLITSAKGLDEGSEGSDRYVSGNSMRNPTGTARSTSLDPLNQDSNPEVIVSEIEENAIDGQDQE